MVDNFLRYIPDQEQVKRRLALDAALFFRAFNQDDLEAFTYVPEQDRPTLYLWLIEQPFVYRNAQDGRHRYHEIAQDMFSRHLSQRSPQGYRTTRKAIADYYRKLLDRAQAEAGELVYETDEWLERVLALIYQLFLLPDEASHISAIEWMLNAYEHTEQVEEITPVLQELSQEQLASQMSSSAQQTVEELLEYFAFQWESLAFLNAVSSLLEKIEREPAAPSELLARIYRNRGKAYRELNEFQQAIEDFNHTLILDPNYAWAYVSRGTTYRLLREYRQAIEDFDQALTLDPNYTSVYIGRGIAYRQLNEYRQAIEDFDQALTLDPNNALVYSLRGETHLQMKLYKKAMEDFDHTLELDSQVVEVYCLRGIAHANREEYEQALADFDRALTLDPSSTWAIDLRNTASGLFKEAQKHKKELKEFHSVADRYWAEKMLSSSSDPPYKKNKKRRGRKGGLFVRRPNQL